MKIYKMAEGKYEELADQQYQQYQDDLFRKQITSVIHREFKTSNNHHIPIKRIDINPSYNDEGIIGLEITVVVPLMANRYVINTTDSSIEIVQSGRVHKAIEELVGVYPEIKLLGDPTP